MSKEPSSHRATGPLSTRPGAPYHKPERTGGSTALTAAGGEAVSGQASAPAPRQAPPRLTINNFPNFAARAKRLPPDANGKAAVHTRLWQFAEPVLFACAKCRRDNIQSDSVAIDQHNRIVLCTMCFTRVVRPRTYRPGRVVPFPSLLSWLNYTPSKATEVAEDAMERPAEAVAPSGNRVALPMLANGDRPMSLDRLPAIAMRMAPASSGGRRDAAGHSAAAGVSAAAASAPAGGKHPCVRVWGVCQHGETCLFRSAPADLCLAFLMGLCSGEHSGRERGQRRCRLLHQEIYDLPNTNDPPPPVRYAGELEESAEEPGPWDRWLARRRRSPNSAEWQLWNNGALKGLFDAFVPVTRRPPAPKKVAPKRKDSEVEGSGTAGDSAAPEADGRQREQEEEQPPASEETPADEGEAVKLNLSDIMSALKGIKK